MTWLRYVSLSPGREKALAWMAAVWLLYTGCGFFVLPLLVRTVAVKRLSKLLDRSVTIQKVQVNPYMLSATITGMLVQDKDDEPLVSWDEAYLNFQLSSLWSRAWIFKEVRLSQPFVRMQIKKDYQLPFLEMIDQLAMSLAPRASASGKGRAIRIDRLRFVGARAAITDLTPRVPFQRTIGPFDLFLTHFSTASGNRNSYAMSGITDGGERIAWQGCFYLGPFHSEGEFSIAGMRLTKYAPLYQDAVRFKVQDGVIDLHSSYIYERSATNQLLSVSHTILAVKSLKIAEAETGPPMLEVSQCLVSGASMDAMARRAEADVVTISGGRLVLHRNKDTSVNVVELAKPADGPSHLPGGILLLMRAMTNVVAMLLNTTNLSTGTVRALSVTNCAVHLEDLVNVQPVRLDLADIVVDAKNISNRTGSNMTGQVRMRWQTNGVLRADIQAALSPPKAELKLAFGKLDLRPLAGYLEPYLHVFVLGGEVGLTGTLELRSQDEKMPELRFQGDAWVDELSLAERIETENLLKWQTLRISGIDANSNPPVLSAKKATLEDVSARLIIETNRTFNLMSALRRPGTNAPAPHPATKVAAGAVWPKVTIASVVLSNAQLHFVDRSLEPTVNITLDGLSGAISKLSSDDLERADVDLRGTIDKTARATIAGRVSPWNQKQPTELNITVNEMDLLPEDPYARKYLGYSLTRGTLSLDTRFRLAEERLKLQNRITLDQLELGEKVESPAATKLPVRLGIAVLKDRNGRIALDVPVDGGLEEVRFHLGNVISSAVETGFNPIATSPFSALSPLFAGEGEALSFLEFEPGSTNLLPASVEKINILVDGLSERPELKLAIRGGVDPKTDSEALGRIRLADEKGSAALMRIVTSGPSVRPLHVAARQSETADALPIRLETLATERAQNVKGRILQTGRIKAERIFITPANATRDAPAEQRRVYFQLQ